MTEAEVAWAAGFIDGEGCVTLSRREGTPRIVISQNVRAPLDELVRLFGGRVYAAQSAPWAWQLGKTADVVNALRAMLPYFRVKRERAELVLEYALYVGPAGQRPPVGAREERARLSRMMFL